MASRVGGRAQRPPGRDVPRDPRHGAHRDVAGELVQAKRESPARGSHEVDLHDDRHRPVIAWFAEEDIGEIDPPPGRRVDDQERDGQREEPSGDQDWLPSDPVGDARGQQVEDRLGDAEAHDEGSDGGLRAEAELLLAQERQHRPLQADHGADEGIQDDEQRELRKILPRPGRLLVAQIRRRFCSAGSGGRSASTKRTKSSFDRCCSARLKRRSKPIVEPGLPLNPLPQAAPLKWAGNISMWSGSVSSLPKRLS
jgi:hypothetical protein